MKQKHPVNFSERGTTLVEAMVAASILVLLGLIFFQVLNSGMILYAKNTAVNSAHEEARDGINRLTRDIHASISVPQLRDTNLNVVSSTPVVANGTAPMAAGVSFQNIAIGPQYVWKDDTNTNQIKVKDGAPPIDQPVEGMRL